MEDFNSKWGSGKNVLIYREGKQRQPQEFQPEQVMVTALDLRTKIQYGIEDYEHEGLSTTFLDHRVSSGCRNRGVQAG